MELVVKERVVITISKMVKHIQKVESEKGYNFEVFKFFGLFEFNLGR